MEDIWNTGFGDIDHYVESSKSSTGQTMDIDSTLSRLKKSMEDLKKANEYTKALSASEYRHIKEVWILLYNESIKLNDKVQANKPEPEDDNYDFDTGLFSQFMYAFIDEAEEIT